MDNRLDHIRNFSIIAHIDHGKSTLADRILEITGALTEREMAAQVLDDMDLERERGITIKAHAVRLAYRAADGRTYQFNLIDTPGHVDFTYEVSRSLAACEGAILVVDASQGVEAQTLANTYLALENDLELVPVLNKIDLPGADAERAGLQIEQIIGLSRQEILPASAKEGRGVREILEAVIARVPPPKGDPDGALKALIFDSWYDVYRGVVMLTRVVDGRIAKGMKIRFMSTGRDYEVEQTGIITPKYQMVDSLSAGEVGFIMAGVKNLDDAKVGDTLTEAARPADEPLPGFQELKPVVFCGMYPVTSEQYEDFSDAMKKLQLNDSAFRFEKETSAALGFGFRCGFLGLLHMEIVQSRLEREFNLDLISTAPSVRYHVIRTDGDELYVENPAHLPPFSNIAAIEEPVYTLVVMTMDDYLGPILSLLEEKRGVQRKFEYVGEKRVMLTYEVPLNEIVVDFYDRLKSVSRGYASMDYHFLGYRESDLVLLDILVNGEPVDALSVIVHRDFAYRRGQTLVSRMKEVIPRQLFEVAIQAAVGNRIIARATVKPLRKNVIAKCYGGDITRKRKLLEKQKEGKKRMKRVGKVEIPQDAFLAILDISND
ncbi:MAG: translation elongation factor 4 [Acidobacteria bacterium]|nr:translation elongation factor 4 [Acidobacteriota bacterium]